MELSTVNLLLLALVAFLVVRRFFFTEVEDNSHDNSTSSEPLLYQQFTPSTLAKYNGKEDPRVLLAVKGKVFDVTMGKRFYGPGGPYENFAGHDASRGLAFNSFDDDMITPVDKPIDTLSDLTDEQKQSLDEWYNHFEGKYTVCGELVGSL